MSETRKSIRKFPPCPYYDIERTESWLSDMSAEGWELEQEGFNLFFACFQKNENPRRMQYRIQAAPVDEVYPQDSIGDPKQEAVELSRKLGWRYISRRGQFYVYAAPEDVALELNTDPQVQAASLQTFLGWTVFWLVCDLWLLLQLGLFLFSLFLRPLTTLVNNNPLYILATMILLCCGIAILFRPFQHIEKLQYQLQRGIPLDHHADWKGSATKHYALWITIIVLSVFTFSHSLYLNMDWNQKDIDNYQKEVPFVVLQDMTEKKVFHSNPQKEFIEEFNKEHGTSFSTDIYDGLDSTVETWFSPVTPVNYIWRERGKIYDTDGTVIAISHLVITHHEAWTPGLARTLAEEYSAAGNSTKSAFDMGVTDLDFVYGYYDDYQQPVLIMQHGKIVIKAYMFKISDGNNICTFQEWVSAMAAKLTE